MKLLGLHHVSINVSDVAEALAFYCNVLGLEQRSDRPAFSFDGAWLNIGAQQLHLIGKTVPDPVGQHFAIQVDDIDVAVAGLRSKGLTVSDPVKVAANRQAFLNDPSGNLVELQEVAASTTGS